MKVTRTHLLIVVCLLVLSASINAQQPSPAKKPETVTPVASNTTPVKDPEAERLIRERRAEAQSLLISLANDAGTFNDQMLRARILARVADLLWETDADRARTLFRKAWDAAETADAEGQERMQKEAREQQARSGGRGYSVVSPPDLRKEVLSLAVKHQVSLGEEFLAKLQEKDKQGSPKNDPIDPRQRDPASTQRLDVAKDLLSSDKERALQLGNPLLNSISMQAIEFLTSLREKDAPLADERYASILSLAAANPQSDLNIVALLSSYLFTPHASGNFLGYGALPLSRTFVGSGPPDVAPALRATFFRMASEILARPVQLGQDRTATNVLYKYNAVLGFLPWFERFATPELTAGLRAQLELLSAMVPENRRRRQEETVTPHTTKPPEPAPDREQSLLDRVDRAKTSAEQDQLYLQLALGRANGPDFKARDYVDKIADGELRQAVRGYIDASLAWKAIQKKDAERALEIVRTGELTRLQKAWTMASAARLLMLPKPDRERVFQILDEAAAEARRMDGSDPDRPRAFLAVANALLAINRTRGWDSMTDVVKAANSAPDFTGADGQLAFRINAKGFRSGHQHGIAEFNVAGVFRLLATEDYNRAVALARVFEHEAPRAHAVMAIAFAVLNEGK